MKPLLKGLWEYFVDVLKINKVGGWILDNLIINGVGG
jgi:hypothetical protein